MPSAETNARPVPSAPVPATLVGQLSCKGKEITPECCGGLGLTLVECSVLSRQQDFRRDLVVGPDKVPVSTRIKNTLATTY